ncbi:BRCA1 protein, partial [Pedionomus torquatus]|nr:BRCA1 protein [Pedionomus torquatus]
FPRFCMFKLLSKKKTGVTQCPLCKTEVTRRSLKENSRFKQLIEGLLETIHAFELDTGVKFSNHPHFPKTPAEATAAELPCKESSVIQSKGFRNRRQSAKENGQGSCTLEANVDTQLTDTKVKRCPPRNKSQKRDSQKGIYIELGKICCRLENKAALQISSREKLEELKSAEKGKEYSCNTQPGKPGAKEVILPNVGGESDFSKEGLSKKSTWSITEHAKPGQRSMGSPVNVLAAGLLAEQCDRTGDASPSSSGEVSVLKHIEETDAEQTRCNGKSKEFDLKDSLESRLGKSKEIAIVDQSVEAVEMYESENDSAHEAELPPEKQHQPETLHSATVNQVSRKRLKRSIQKVNEWFSKSNEILSSSSSLDDSAGASDVSGEGDACLSDKDSCVSEKTDPMVAPMEITVVEGNKRQSKQTADSIKDKIFGKTYKRERKSNCPATFRDVLPTAKKGAVTADENNSSKGGLKRKRKTSRVLQPEDFIRKKDAEEAGGCPQSDNLCLEDAERKRCDQSPAARESHPSENREELQEGEGSAWKKATEKVTGRLCEAGLELSNSHQESTKRSSAAKRCRRSRTKCALQLVVDRNSVSSDSTEPQIDSYPSSEEPRKADPEQRQVRRSRRLQLLSEEMTKETGKGVAITRARKSDHEGSFFGGQRNVLVHTSECRDLCEPQGTPSYQPLANQEGGGVEANDVKVSLKNPSDTAETGKSLFNPTPSCQRSHCSSFVPDTGSQEGEMPDSPCLLQSSSGVVVQTASHPAAESPELAPASPQESGLDGQNVPGDFGTDKLPMAKNGLELTKEAEDSDLDTQYLRNIFRHSKRQSFSLCPSAIKAPAAEDATSEISEVAGTDQVENQRNKCLENLQEKKTTAESLGRVGEKEEPKSCESPCVSPVTGGVGSAEWAGQHREGVSQVGNEGNATPLRTGTAGTRGNNRSQKRKQGDEETVSAGTGVERELGQNPSRSNGSQGEQSDAEESVFKKTDEMCFSSESNQAGEAEGVDSQGQIPQFQSRSVVCPAACQQRPAEFGWEVAGEKSSKRERKQIKENEEQGTQTAGTGVPECLVTEAAEEPPKGSSDVAGLSETPDGLLCSDGDIEENNSFSATDRRERSAVFLKRSDSAPVKTPRNSNVSSKPRSRRRVRKLQSSDEDSSEDEDFPCFQSLLFGKAVSTPLQTNKQGTSVGESSVSPVTLPPDKSHNASNRQEEAPEAAGNSGCVSPSQESECSVNLFSSQSNVSEESADGAQELKKPLIPDRAPERVGDVNERKETSQSRDGGLERSKTYLEEECREEPRVGANPGGASGYDSETSNVEDSCGLFSQDEILTTQQKNAMQNNLKKLQQEMAALEAVLQRHGSQELLPVQRELPHSSSEGRRGMEHVRPEGENTDEQKSGTRLKSASILSNLSGNVARNPNNSSSSVRLLNPPTVEAANRPVAARNVDKSSARECKSKRNVPFPLSVPHNAAGKENTTSPVVTDRKEMSIVASGLNQSEHLVVQKFARKTHSTLSNRITQETTHVVMKTDKDLVCERTLKYFLGIAGRKWVVSYQWVIQSFKEGRILDEENFEVRGDVINGRNHQGPRRARQSLTEKIFKGFEICCCGPFTDMTPEHLEWMVELCGASVVKELHLFTHAENSTAVVVVEPDAWTENTNYRAIQGKNNVSMVTREWVLDSVACYRCQELGPYLVS